MLPNVLRAARARLNPSLPGEAVEDALRKLSRSDGPTLEARNRVLHRYLVDGVTVEYRHPEGRIVGAQVCVRDFDRPDSTDWLAIKWWRVTIDSTR